MNKENRKIITDDYNYHTAKTSNLSMCIVGVISVLQIYGTGHITSVVAVFWFLSMVQHIMASVINELLRHEVISVELGNKLTWLSMWIFYIKISIPIIMIGSLL